jgi:hypothetical protein
MKKRLKDLASKAASGASKAVTLVGDLNGDGKVDASDWEIARSRAKEFTDEVGDEAARLGKSVMRAEVTRDVATGAAIGAAVAIPVPIVGPAAGAVVGAGVGLYKNLTKSGEGSAAAETPAISHHAIDDLAKLDDLRQRGILTDDEFQAQKRKLLRRS